MISIGALWLPIVVAAVFIFFVSFVLHMVLPWHKGDYKKLPAEDEIRDESSGWRLEGNGPRPQD